MAEYRAADLPTGSVVATNHEAYIKTHPTMYAQWRSTSGAHVPDRLIDEDLEGGAEVLRVGTGQEG